MNSYGLLVKIMYICTVYMYMNTNSPLVKVKRFIDTTLFS